MRREWVLSRNIVMKQRQNYSKGLNGPPRDYPLVANGRLHLPGCPEAANAGFSAVIGLVARPPCPYLCRSLRVSAGNFTGPAA